MAQFVTALGLVFVIEGLLYALVPGQLRRMMESLKSLQDEQLRVLGTIALGVGVLVIWLARAFLQN
jgi:uncharacterized protein YjeT (DUF2065 family)